MQLVTAHIQKPDDVNIILGQAHFIKTVEDLYEALVTAMPGIRFGLAFNESSGPALVRSAGTDPELERLAQTNALEIGAGHLFVILLRNAYPINVLGAVRAVPEVVNIYCATANPVEVVLAETDQGRGVLGVVDGVRPQGVETLDDVAHRKAFLRTIGYKVS
ncbi:MAG: adenosine-specific kinase [Chloroflexi bacterium]|nr:adenosine-specific kinase [Chloroflexota bacterium]